MMNLYTIQANEQICIHEFHNHTLSNKFLKEKVLELNNNFSDLKSAL